MRTHSTTHAHREPHDCPGCAVSIAPHSRPLLTNQVINECGVVFRPAQDSPAHQNSPGGVEVSA